MHPTLFYLGSLGIHSYGVAISVGFLPAILLGVRAARRQGIRVDQLLDLAFWILVSTILGARLLYLITEAPSYARVCLGSEAPAPRGALQILYDCSRPLQLWEGGLVFYGGLCAATFATLWFCRRKGLSFLRVGDLVAPLAAIGHFFGRVGCFEAGCCYGKPTASGLGLAFPPESMIFQEMARGGLLDPRAAATPPVFPTQLYPPLRARAPPCRPRPSLPLLARHAEAGGRARAPPGGAPLPLHLAAPERAGVRSRARDLAPDPGPRNHTPCSWLQRVDRGSGLGR